MCAHASLCMCAYSISSPVLPAPFRPRYAASSRSLHPSSFFSRTILLCPCAPQEAASLFSSSASIVLSGWVAPLVMSTKSSPQARVVRPNVCMSCTLVLTNMRTGKQTSFCLITLHEDNKRPDTNRISTLFFFLCMYRLLDCIMNTINACKTRNKRQSSRMLNQFNDTIYIFNYTIVCNLIASCACLYQPVISLQITPLHSKSKLLQHF